MKTLSSMYVRPMWEDGCWLRTDQATLSHDLAFHSKIHSKILQNLNKFRINSNKLGKIGINWNRQWAKQAGCDLTVVGREHSDLTYNSANYQWRKRAQRPDIQFTNWLWPYYCRCSRLTTVQITSKEREHSDLMYNLQTDCGLTVVGREHSDLMHNSANYQWRKGAQRPDVQYCSLCRRLLLEGSKVTWWTTLSAAVQTIVGRERSGLTSTQT